MVQQNEKKAMKSAHICSGAGPVQHMVLPLRVCFTHYLQTLLVLALCTGFALSTSTTVAASAAQSGQEEVLYFIEVTVNVLGPKKDEKDIIDWLQPVFQNNLHTCGSSVIATTSTPIISTSAFTANMTVSTTLQTNTTKNTDKTSHTTTNVATITASTSGSNATTAAATSNPITTPSTTSSFAKSTATSLATTLGPTMTLTTPPSTVTTLTSNSASTVHPTTTGKTEHPATSRKTTSAATTQSEATTSGRTTHLPPSSVTMTTDTNSPTSTSATLTPLIDTATIGKPPNNPNNPNSRPEEKTRTVREISMKAAGIFKDFEAFCVETTSIRKTTCFVTLSVKERVNPCCILQTLCAASKSSTSITVTGKRAERTGSLIECSNPSEDVCVYTGPTVPKCVESGTLYSIPSSNSTHCGTENECTCSTYCSKTDAYYTFNTTTENPQITESHLTFLLYSISGSQCPTCPSPEIASKYKTSSVTCTKDRPLKCTVVAVFTEAVPVCALSDLVVTLLKAITMNMSGQLTRAAICGNTVENAHQLLQSPHKLIDVNVTHDKFCMVTKNIQLFKCQPEESVVVMLDEQCRLATTTATPNTTTFLQPNTTLSANETMNTTASTNTTSSPVNETTTIVSTTTLSANETMNTTATTNTTSTPVNETTIVSTTTLSANETMNTTTTTNPTSTPVNETTTLVSTTAGSSLETANALLEMTKDASQLNSSQVDQLVSTLENLLSGPTVSMALGNLSVGIVSNLLSASPEAVFNSQNRIIGITDQVSLKLVLNGHTESILSADLAVAVQQADGANFRETSFSITNPNNVEILNPRARRAARDGPSVPQGSITLPPTLTQNLTAEQQQMVSRVQFNFYQKSTLFQDKSMGDKIFNSGILGASVTNLSISGLQDDVIISLRNIHTVPANYVAVCVFWDITMNDGSGGWNPNGCKVHNSTDNETICGCNHLTSFGILLDLSREPITSRVQATILTFITYIGCGVSAIFLAITVLTYLAFGKLRKDIPSKILIHLCLALLLLNLVFLVDAWLALYPDAVGLCISTAWFLHYFLLVAFTWMGLEAVHMYIALVKVFNSHISHYMLKFSLAGWGIPMIVVIIVIAIDKDNYGLVSYGRFSDGTTDEFCWIRNDVAFYVAVVAYFCAIFLFNMVMFIIVLVQLRRLKKQNPHNLQHRTTLQDVRSVLGITVLLGLTWGFSFFAWGPVNLPFMYLFAIFNSLQGFFIFVFHCAVKDNVRRQWRTYLCCGRMRLAENSEWSRTATQKTTKKSSVAKIRSLHSSMSNNSSGSSSYLVSDSSDQMNGFGSPFSDHTITAEEDPRMDVILNELNSQYRRL